MCVPYIYPIILDWQNNPWIAIGVITGLCLAMPLFHSFWMIFSNLRQFLHQCCFKQDEPLLAESQKATTIV